MWEGVGRCGECREVQGGVGRCGEVWGVWRGAGRCGECGEVQGGAGRCGKVWRIWRGAGRYGECGEVQEVAHCLPFPADQLAQLPVVLLPLEALSVGACLLWPIWKSERRREQGTTLLFR